MKFHEISWDFMWFHVISWIFMDLHGPSWTFMRFYVISWDVMLIFWNCLGLNYIFFYGLSSPIFLKTTAQSYPAQCFPDTGLSSPVIIWSESQKPWGSPAHFFQMGSLQPSPKLKWISNTLGLSSPIFFQMGSLQPSPKLKWISNTLGLSSHFFFPNGLSPAQSKVEMNLKHLGAAQPGLKLKFSRDLVVLKLVDLLYLLNSLGCPAQWCLILISNLMGSPAQMNYGSYSPSTKGLYNPSLQHCFPHTLFCGAVQFVRIKKKNQLV